MRARALAAALLAAALLAACDYDPRGRCDSARECLAGQVCSGGVCAAPAPGPANQPPSAAPDAHPVPSSGELHCVAPCLLANDSDPDGDPLQAERVSHPAHGLVFVEPSGAFRYYRFPGEPPYSGPDAFQYRVSDGALPSAPATVTLTVAAP